MLKINRFCVSIMLLEGFLAGWPLWQEVERLRIWEKRRFNLGNQNLLFPCPSDGFGSVINTLLAQGAAVPHFCLWPTLFQNAKFQSKVNYFADPIRLTELSVNWSSLGGLMTIHITYHDKRLGRKQCLKSQEFGSERVQDQLYKARYGDRVDCQSNSHLL